MSDPNDFPCECGHILTSESCFCPGCGVRLCGGCVFEDDCTEWQGDRVGMGGGGDKLEPKVLATIDEDEIKRFVRIGGGSPRHRKNETESEVSKLSG